MELELLIVSWRSHMTPLKDSQTAGLNAASSWWAFVFNKTNFLKGAFSKVESWVKWLEGRERSWHSCLSKIEGSWKTICYNSHSFFKWRSWTSDYQCHWPSVIHEVSGKVGLEPSLGLDLAIMFHLCCLGPLSESLGIAKIQGTYFFTLPITTILCSDVDFTDMERSRSVVSVNHHYNP